MAKVPVINLRKGHAVNYNNDVCVVVSMEHKCPPRMASYVQMSIRSISTKKVYNLRLTSNESLEGVNLAREEYEFSYIDGMGYHFMNPATMAAYSVFLGCCLLTFYCLSHLPMITVNMLECSAYVYILLFDRIFFGKPITVRKVGGNAMIIAGIIVCLNR